MKNGGGASGLDEVAGLHDEEAMADLMEEAEIVGDKKNGHVMALVEVLEKVDNAFLGGGIEGGGGLIRDEQVGLGTDGGGDGEPLEHTTAEHGGKGLEDGFGWLDTDLGEGLGGAVAGGLTPQAGADADGLDELVADGKERVEAGGRFLKDVAQALAAELAQEAWRGAEEIVAGFPEVDGSLVAGSGGGREEAAEGEGRNGFSGTAFAGEAKDFGAGEGKGDALDGLDGRVADLDGEVGDLEERRVVGVGVVVGHQRSNSDWAAAEPGERPATSQPRGVRTRPWGVRWR